MKAELGRKLTRWERWLIDRVFLRSNAYWWLHEHFGAEALDLWGRAAENQAGADEVSRLIKLDDVTPVVPPRQFLRG